jgi:ZIP family zinc transporter
VLAFGAAALMFLVTEELLTEAHEEKETPLLTATFFAGFLAFLILGMVA